MKSASWYLYTQFIVFARDVRRSSSDAAAGDIGRYRGDRRGAAESVLIISTRGGEKIERDDADKSARGASWPSSNADRVNHLCRLYSHYIPICTGAKSSRRRRRV